MAVPLMCCAADMLGVPSRRQVVLVGKKPSPEFDGMLDVAQASYDPNKTVRRENLNSCMHFICLLSLSCMGFVAFCLHR